MTNAERKKMTKITKNIQAKLNELTGKFAGKKFVKVKLDIANGQKIKVYENEITEIRYDDIADAFCVVFAETPKIDHSLSIFVFLQQRDGEMKAEKALERLERGIIDYATIGNNVRYRHERGELWHPDVEEIVTDSVFNGDTEAMKAEVKAELIKVAAKKVAALQMELKKWQQIAVDE